MRMEEPQGSRRTEAPPDTAPLVALLCLVFFFISLSFFFTFVLRFVNLQRNSGFCLLCYYRRVGSGLGLRLGMWGMFLAAAVG